MTKPAMPSEDSRTSRNVVGPAVNSAKPPVHHKAIAPAVVVAVAEDAADRDAASAAVAEAGIAEAAVVDTAVAVGEAVVDVRRASASPRLAPNAASKRKYRSNRPKVARSIVARVTCRARIREWAAADTVTAVAAVAAEDTTTRATISPHESPTSIDRIEAEASGPAVEAVNVN